jgi:hypothetical protein
MRAAFTFLSLDNPFPQHTRTPSSGHRNTTLMLLAVMALFIIVESLAGLLALVLMLYQNDTVVHRSVDGFDYYKDIYVPLGMCALLNLRESLLPIIMQVNSSKCSRSCTAV